MIVDQQVRLQALDPSESFIVQAPAGSGKTELLVSRYLSLLSKVNNPEEIVAITFTKKAAMEMQARVIQALNDALDHLVPSTEHGQRLMAIANAALAQDKKQNWHLLDNTARLKITTIDSLCASITAQLPVTALFGEHYQVTEQPYRLYQGAVLELIKGLGDDMPYNPALKTLLLYLDNRIDLFESLLANMLAKREMWLDVVVEGLRHDCLSDVLERSRLDLIESALEKAVHFIPSELVVPIKELLAHAQGKSLNSTWQLDDYQTVANFLLTQTGSVRRTVDKRQGFEPKTDEKAQMLALLADCQSHPGFIEQLNTARLLPTVTFTHASWEVIEALMQVLIAAVAHLQVVFKSKGEVDFNEIALLALKSLGDEQAPTDIMLKLDYRLSHLLVDEFQDTSQLQYRLFLALTRGWTGDDGRTLFFVGDPMQSIYRFRQAEVGLFMQISETGLGNIHLTPLSLQSNFRSDKGVIDWVNQTFSQLFSSTPDTIKGAVSYHASVAVSESAGAVQLCFAPTPNAEVAQMVNRISQLQASAPDKRIAILVRARTHLKALLPALTDAGIAYVGVDIEVLTNRPEVLDCLSLSYALFNLEDALSWMALLRSPMFGFALSDLEQIARAQDGRTVFEALSDKSVQSALSEYAQAMLTQKWPLLEQQVTYRYRTAVAEQLYQAWQLFGGPATCESEAQLENAEQYFKLLGRFYPKNRLPARADLERALLSLFAKPNLSGANPITVMTIHKAKGLEFDVVFCPMLDRASRAEERPLMLWQDREQTNQHELLIAPHRGKEKEDSPMYRFLFELEKERSKHELVRLFYVAVTRAKSELMLSATVTSDGKGLKKPKSGSILAMLHQVIDPESVEVLAGESLSETEVRASFKRIESSWQPVLEPIMPTEDLNQPEPPALHQHDWRAIGVVVHAYLELIANTGALDFNPEAAISAIEKRLIAEGVEDLDFATAKVIEALSNTLSDEKGRWILSAHESGACELAVVSQKQHKLKTQVIDRTFVEKGERWIIDYKVVETADNESYQAQLSNYAKLMRALDKGKYPIRLMVYYPLLRQAAELGRGSDKNIVIARA